MARPRLVVAVVVVAVVGAAAGIGLALARDDATSRQEQVAERGRRVMPFDLDATTHVFRADARGGVQEVLADDVADRRNVRLVRMHLQEEAAAFSRGDFGDPAAIHGDEMPGLSALRAGYRRISVRYAKLPAGARLTYRTEDPELVRALRAWFDAQLFDRGAHATHGTHAGEESDTER